MIYNRARIVDAVEANEPEQLERQSRHLQGYLLSPGFVAMWFTGMAKGEWMRVDSPMPEGAEWRDAYWDAQRQQFVVVFEWAGDDEHEAFPLVREGEQIPMASASEMPVFTKKYTDG